jgi:hypothetical protein
MIVVVQQHTAGNVLIDGHLAATDELTRRFQSRPVAIPTGHRFSDALRCAGRPVWTRAARSAVGGNDAGVAYSWRPGFCVERPRTFAALRLAGCTGAPTS